VHFLLFVNLRPPSLVPVNLTVGLWDHGDCRRLWRSFCAAAGWFRCSAGGRPYVQIVPHTFSRINDVEYIKTVDNGNAQDNLDNLPAF